MRGLACSMSATEPETTAVDMLVPERRRYVPPEAPVTRAVGLFCHKLVELFDVDTMFVPGATTSGLIIQPDGSFWLPTGPRELHGATVSSERYAVLCVFVAPTVSASGA